MTIKPTYDELLKEIERLKLKLEEKKTLEQEQEFTRKATQELSLAKENAEKSEMLYRRLIENSPWGMHFYRLENNSLIFTGANPAADKLLHVSNAQFIDKTIEEAFPPLMQTEIPFRYREAAEKGHLWKTEQISYDDNKITGAFEVIAFQTTSGNMVAVFNDITERKQHEEQLKEKNEEYQQLNKELIKTNSELVYAKQCLEKSEERFRLILKNSNDTFVLINKNGEQFYISDVAESDTDFTVDELKGPIQNVIFPADLDIVLQAWEKLLNTKNEVVRVQYRHKHKFKEYIWYEAAAQNHLDNPAINAVVVNIREISAIKETETKLIKAKEQAEASDRLKTAFLQNMSHEIRTPMNAIMGFAGLMAENYSNREKLEQYSAIIEQRSHDLLAIINDMLDISKIESGQGTLQLEECNLNELFLELALFFTDYQHRADKQHIQLLLHNVLDEDIAHIITDQHKLKQIFINLITNAFKFTESGRIECGCKLVNNQLLFHVSDTGVGTPGDKHEFIFERFTRIDTVISKSYVGGTGLGLPIVKGLVGLLGGKVWLKSEPNLGTTFYFTIDFKRIITSNSVSVTSADTTQHFASNQNLLIVEDDQNNALYLEEVMKNYFSKVYIVGTGLDAIKLVNMQPIDLVLMDVRLPDITGYEATKTILQQMPKLKIIAQTAYAAQEERQRALNAGCVDYISKPLKREELLSIIRRHLKK